MNALRDDLEPLPTRMLGLPIDARGYVVPWFVGWAKAEDGTLYPEHRSADPEKFRRAIKEKRCWVCGERLGKYYAFILGPMCGITHTTSEPPNHLECAMWSIRNCPFLSRPHMTRRGDLLTEYTTAHPAAGIMIERNPGVSIVWVTTAYRTFSDGKKGTLINVADATELSFWSEGRPATREEIMASVDSGIPALEAVCENDPKQLKFLAEDIATFRALIP